MRWFSLVIPLSFLACQPAAITCPNGVCDTGPCEPQELFIDDECVRLCIVTDECRPDEYCDDGLCRMRPAAEKVSALTSSTPAVLGRSPVNELVTTAAFSLEVVLRDVDSQPVAGVLAEHIVLEISDHCPNPGILHPTRDADNHGRTRFDASELAYAGGACASVTTPAARLLVEGAGVIATFNVIVSPDQDGDGDIDRDDRAALVAAIAGTGPLHHGDFNGDGDIDGDDEIIFESHYLAQQRKPSAEYSSFPHLMRSPANPMLGDNAHAFAGWIGDQLGDPMTGVAPERITLEILDSCLNPGVIHPETASDSTGHVVFPAAHLDSGGACLSGTGAAVVSVDGVAVVTLLEVMSPDEDGDGDVDNDDLDVFVAARSAPIPPLHLGDFNGDGKLDVSDLSIFGTHKSVFTPAAECGNSDIEYGESCDGPLEHGTCDNCETTVCEANYGDCDFNPANGCEINLLHHYQHCGSCFTECEFGCDHGECAVAPGTQACGNGIVEYPEECDQGASNNDAGWCRSSCMQNRCGDGFLWVGVEDCDDGNDEVDDACPSGALGLCRQPYCGDGYVAPTEDCDDANNIHSDDCVACVEPTCGDGFVHQGVEACDSEQFLANADCLGCSAIECIDDYGNCDGNTVNGCETNLDIDEANCGRCGNRCEGQCIAGICQLVDREDPEIDTNLP